MIEESKEQLPAIGISRNCIVHRYNHRQVQQTNMDGVEETFWQCDSIFVYTGKNIEKLPIRIAGVLKLQSQNLTQIEVDSILECLYQYRTEFVEGAPLLNIGGNNESPSGVYHHSGSPNTGKQYQHALINDDGHNKWAIMHAEVIDGESDNVTIIPPDAGAAYEQNIETINAITGFDEIPE